MALVNEAQAKFARAQQDAELERQQRIHAVWWRCRHSILNGMAGLHSLPGEVIGAEIAEGMMHEAYRRMLEQAMAQRAAEDEVRPDDIRVASPLIVPG